MKIRYNKSCKRIILLLSVIFIFLIFVKMSGCFYKEVSFYDDNENFGDGKLKDYGYSFQFWYLRNDLFVWVDEECYSDADLKKLKDTMSCRLILEGRSSQGSFDYKEFTDYKIKDLKVILKNENGNIVKENGVFYVFIDKEKSDNNIRSYDSIDKLLSKENDLTGNFFIEVFYDDKDKKIENMKHVYMEAKCLLFNGEKDEEIYFNRKLHRKINFRSRD